MIIKKQILIGITTFLLMVTFYPLEATRIIKFINNTKRPNSDLQFSLTTFDGTFNHALGQFKSSLNLDSIKEIPKNSPLILEVAIPRGAPSHAYDAGEIDDLQPGTTYSITRLPIKGYNSFEIRITPITK